MKANFFKNSRYVYFDTASELNNIKKHSHLRIKDKTYKIDLYNKITKIFEYHTIDDDIITIKDPNARNILMKSDLITLTIPIYSLDTVIKIKSSPTGFKVGDIIFERSEKPFSFIVTSIDNEGRITGINIQDEGYYDYKPDTEMLDYVDFEGNDYDIEMDLVFKEAATKNIDVIIDRINYSSNEIILNLNAKVLPFNYKSKCVVQKYCVVLSDEYLRDTEQGVICEISSDFTPYLNLPYALQNSPSIHALYNESIEAIDKKMEELNDRITKLEGLSS